MTTGDRKFDPEAVEEFKAYIEEKLKDLDEDVVPHMKGGGVLTKGPAFGLIEAGSTEKYNTFYREVFNDIQEVRGNYCAILRGLQAALDGNDVSEAMNCDDLNDLGAALE